MIHLGNFKNWVNKDLLDKVLNQEGQKRPGAEESIGSKQQESPWTNIENIGAKWSFYYNEIGVDDLDLPIEYKGRVNWWFVKLNPTCVFPLHKDTFHDDSTTARRLWIPYQDYEPGHIFIYKDTFIKNYTAGDIFEFDDPMALHGSANISTIPKVSLQIIIYND